MESAGSQVPINGKNPPNIGSVHISQQALSTLVEKIFLNKGPICAANELSGFRTGMFPGLDLCWKLNNATALRGGHVPSQGGRLS